MLKVAITGGIGTGKTHVRARLEAQGVPAIDADAVVHRLLGAGSAITTRVIERFGIGVMAESGAVDRRRLASIVFADRAARLWLEQLVHPVVNEEIAAWFTALPAGVGPGWALADVPLLFETGRDRWFDQVIVVACAPEEQVRRIISRDGLSEADARARLAAQQPIAQKVARADYVVWTDGGFDDTDRQVDRIYRLLTAFASGRP